MFSYVSLKVNRPSSVSSFQYTFYSSCVCAPLSSNDFVQFEQHYDKNVHVEWSIRRWAIWPVSDSFQCHANLIFCANSCCYQKICSDLITSNSLLQIPSHDSRDMRDHLVVYLWNNQKIFFGFLVRSSISAKYSNTLRSFDKFSLRCSLYNVWNSAICFERFARMSLSWLKWFWDSGSSSIGQILVC